jgi:hypothetical protein
MKKKKTEELILVSFSPPSSLSHLSFSSPGFSLSTPIDSSFCSLSFLSKLMSPLFAIILLCDFCDYCVLHQNNNKGQTVKKAKRKG